MFIEDTRKKSIERAQRRSKGLFYSKLILLPILTLILLGWFLDYSLTSKANAGYFFGITAFIDAFSAISIVIFLAVSFKYLISSYVIEMWEHRGKKTKGEIDKLSYMDRVQ